MKTLGLVALIGAGAGIGYLLFSEKGRGLVEQASRSLEAAQGRLSDSFGGGGGVQQIVGQALKTPHPDTAIAGAFEEALA